EAGRGASFETFAGIRIRGAMIDEIRRGDWAPRSVHRNARRVATAIRAVEARSGGDAGDAAIARELGVGLEEYHGLLQDTLGCRLFSLDELLDDAQGERVQPVGADDDPAEQVARERTAAAVAAAIERLPERERLALSLYYDEELNLKEIGLVLEVSESRVSQILSQATQRLRARFARSTT
ncbi:MAG TPA: RNA polymerase sigma factor FliA, partial [Pseudomonadales bacterium]|nr:RNA polymerase sigma factor FliA [Pseudomonadales bacterium]